MKPLRIVNYAVNGSGVGHLTRLIAINRWLRRYAAYAEVDAEIYFLTSSEADGLLFREKFASFKVPSKSVVGEAGIDKLTYLSLAKQWIWHSLGLLRPDLLIVDSFPRGSFGELLSALDLARHKAFVYRPMRDSFAGRPDFQAMLPLYDAIVVPGSPAPPVPPEAADRVRHVPPITARERVECLSRDEARRELGLPALAKVVYVSAGGGGDAVAASQLETACAAALKHDDVHVLLAAGPLYRGALKRHPRLTALGSEPAAELMAAADLAVCAAGYNTFHELMQAGVPAIFLPQEKVADEQRLRAQSAVSAGAALLAGGAPLEDLIGRLLEPGRRAQASAAARALFPRNGARHAAAEILKLALPPAEVEAAVAAVTDEVIAHRHDTGSVIEVMRFTSGPDTRPADASRLAVELSKDLGALGLAPAEAARLLPLLSKKLSGSTAERCAAARAVVQALAPFGDWPGAASLLKVLVTERELDAAELAGQLCRLLGALRARGEDLYRGIARLSAVGALNELGNRGALRGALAALEETARRTA